MRQHKCCYFSVRKTEATSKVSPLFLTLVLLSFIGTGCSDNSDANSYGTDTDITDTRKDPDTRNDPDAQIPDVDASPDIEPTCTESCSRVRLDGGLSTGTSTFGGETFYPLIDYLSEGVAHDIDDGVQNNIPIAGTDFDALYQRGTWVESDTATFSIAVDNGNYTVHLHFADWLSPAPGERIFHADLQGERKLTDFDIVAEAGQSTALLKSFNVVVSDGAVTLTLTNNRSVAALVGVEILGVGEAHLATTEVPVCGASDGVCPDGCTASEDADCPVMACEGHAVSSLCLCGTTEVSSGYCCNASPQSEACVVSPAFYVSPTGDDANSGTSMSEPFRTLEKARDTARASTTTKTVYLLEGIYERTETLELLSADQGQSWLGYPG